MLQLKTLSAQFLFFIFLGLLSGCQLPDRINHRNNPTNANAIDSDTASFASFTSTNSGLQTQIQGDNNAQLVLMQQVDNAHEKLRETYFGMSVGDKTWLSLKAQMWKDFGIETNIDKFEQATTATNLIELEPEIATNDISVTNQINIRIRKIQAIGKVLQALTQGQAALATQAAKQASNNLNSLTSLLQKTSSATNNPIPNGGGATSTNNFSIDNMLLLLQTEVIAVGKQWSENDSVRTNATALQKLILQQAENSRVPASAYALVAIIGTGLGSNDMASLDDFLTNLQARIVSDLSSNSQPNLATNGNSKGLVYTSKYVNEDFFASAKKQLINTLTNTISPQSISKGISLSSLNTRDKSSPNYYGQAFFDSCASAYQLVLSLTNAYTATSGSDFQKSTITANLSSTTINANTNANNSLAAIADAMPAAAEAISSAAQSMQVNLGGFQKVLQDTNAIVEFTSLLSSGGTNYTQILPLLLNVSSLIPKVSQLLNQNILQNTNLIQQWAKIGNDIQSESLAAGARLMQFFYDLSQTETSLYQENARHYTAVGSIGAKEIQRWDWIGDIYQRITYLYQVNWTNQYSGDTFDTNSLFMDSPAIDAFQKFYLASVANTSPSAGNRGYANKWEGIRILPTVLPTDRIIPSIRILSENAYEHQNASPSLFDPIGLYTQISVNRLKQAVELVLSSDFILNYNKQQADVLHRLLLGEINEHSVNVDSIVLSTYEADIRLQLGDSKAFHDTGITDADLELVLQTLETGFVGWISAKQ